MKSLKIIIFLLSMSLAFSACDKPFTEDDDEIEQKDDLQGNDDSSGGNDESGNNDSSGDEDNDNDDSGINLGDVVDVKTFINTAIYTQVWVKGYIVGCGTGANGKTRYTFDPPFSYDTALLIADNADEGDETKVASVCLTSCSKKIRALLNLKDHPENKGKRIAVFGFQQTYLKIFGIKKIDAYEFPAE